MQRYFGFLRAINVGGRNVKMAALRSIFEEIGCENVSTLIASGNVIFQIAGEDPSALEILIEEALQRSLGYRVETFLRTPDALTSIVGQQPFGPDAPGEGEALHVGFLKAAIAKDRLIFLDRFQTESDAFHHSGREIYWFRRGRVSDSEFSNAALEKGVGGPATFRNLTTLRKLVALPDKNGRPG